MTLECIPCSRVGHIFRTGDFWKGQVYKVPYEAIVRDKLRAAERPGDNQLWIWNQSTGQISDDHGNMCIEVTQENSLNLIMTQCVKGKASQVWEIGGKKSSEVQRA